MVSRAEYQKEWRKKNPGKASAYSKKWSSNNREAYLIALSNWREENQEPIKDYQKTYKQVNLRQLVTYNRNRRAKHKNIEGVHTKQDIDNLLISQYGICNGCNNQLIDYEVDHVIPLSCEGSNWPSNLQLLCPTCNRSKHDKNMDEWSKYKELLIKNG